MAQSQNTVREIFVAKTLQSHTTLEVFKDTSVTHDVGVVAADGGAAGPGKNFFIVLNIGDGKIITSDVIKSDTLKKPILRDKDFVEEALKAVTISNIVVPDTAGQKAEYLVDLRLFNHGSLSIENFIIFHGQFVLTQGATASTAEEVVDGLIKNLNKNFSKHPNATPTTNPLFTFTKVGAGAGATLVITAKEQKLELGKKEGRPIEFDVVFKTNAYDDVLSGGDVAVTTPGNPGVGTVRQVALMEFSYRGNRGDIQRGVGYPYTWDQSSKTRTIGLDVNGFNLVEIKHFVNGDGLNALILPKELTIAIDEAVSQAAIVAEIEAFLA